MAKRLSLSQQIAQLDTPAPDIDTEDFIGNTRNESDGEEPEEGSGARDHYVDVGPSSLRRLQDSIPDPKYDGRKTSRKELLEGNSSEEDEKDENEEPEEQLESDDDSQSESEEEEEEATSGHDEINTRRETLPAETDGLSATLRQKRDEDWKKGVAVSKQIHIWDTLLDARIQLQRSTTASNRLSANHWQNFSRSAECEESLKRVIEEANLLSQEIMSLQERLASNESLPLPPRKKRRTDIESLPGSETSLIEASNFATVFEHSVHPHLLQTLAKWSSKIQAVAPSVLLPANRNAFSKDRQQIKGAVQLIDEHLIDQVKLLSRTRVWRGKGERLGVSPSDGDEKQDMEIFDDTDFYQQLLRDVIDSRDASGATNWMVAQKERREKKKVDTKASKGRKIRYEVHDKLRNFMVPITIRGAWHDEQIDELFASVLGRGPESREEASSTGISSKMNGFRLFG